MKKTIAIVSVLLISLFSLNCFAQLKEVRGVQTRLVKYDSSSQPNKYGFEFTNENNYTVWVEAELHTHGFTYSGIDVQRGVRDTKSFTLKPGETYTWKCGDKMQFSSYGSYSDYHEKFYVKYNAYKAE